MGESKVHLIPNERTGSQVFDLKSPHPLSQMVRTAVKENLEEVPVTGQHAVQAAAALREMQALAVLQGDDTMGLLNHVMPPSCTEYAVKGGNGCTWMARIKMQAIMNACGVPGPFDGKYSLVHAFQNILRTLDKSADEIMEKQVLLNKGVTKCGTMRGMEDFPDIVGGSFPVGIGMLFPHGKSCSEKCQGKTRLHWNDKVDGKIWGFSIMQELTSAPKARVFKFVRDGKTVTIDIPKMGWKDVNDGATLANWITPPGDDTGVNRVAVRWVKLLDADRFWAACARKVCPGPWSSAFNIMVQSVTHNYMYTLIHVLVGRFPTMVPTVALFEIVYCLLAAEPQDSTKWFLYEVYDRYPERVVLFAKLTEPKFSWWAVSAARCLATCHKAMLLGNRVGNELEHDVDIFESYLAMDFLRDCDRLSKEGADHIRDCKNAMPAANLKKVRTEDSIERATVRAMGESSRAAARQANQSPRKPTAAGKAAGSGSQRVLASPEKGGQECGQRLSVPTSMAARGPPPGMPAKGKGLPAAAPATAPKSQSTGQPRQAAELPRPNLRPTKAVAQAPARQPALETGAMPVVVAARAKQQAPEQGDMQGDRPGNEQLEPRSAQKMGKLAKSRLAKELLDTARLTVSSDSEEWPRILGMLEGSAPGTVLSAAGVTCRSQFTDEQHEQWAVEHGLAAADGVELTAGMVFGTLNLGMKQQDLQDWLDGLCSVVAGTELAAVAATFKPLVLETNSALMAPAEEQRTVHNSEPFSIRTSHIAGYSAGGRQAGLSTCTTIKEESRYGARAMAQEAAEAAAGAAADEDKDTVYEAVYNSRLAQPRPESPNELELAAKLMEETAEEFLEKPPLRKLGWVQLVNSVPIHHAITLAVRAAGAVAAEPRIFGDEVVESAKEQVETVTAALVDMVAQESGQKKWLVRSILAHWLWTVGTTGNAGTEEDEASVGFVIRGAEEAVDHAHRAHQGCAITTSEQFEMVQTAVLERVLDLVTSLTNVAGVEKMPAEEAEVEEADDVNPYVVEIRNTFLVSETHLRMVEEACDDGEDIPGGVDHKSDAFKYRLSEKTFKLIAGRDVRVATSVQDNMREEHVQLLKHAKLGGNKSSHYYVTIEWLKEVVKDVFVVWTEKTHTASVAIQFFDTEDAMALCDSHPSVEQDDSKSGHGKAAKALATAVSTYCRKKAVRLLPSVHIALGERSPAPDCKGDATQEQKAYFEFEEALLGVYARTGEDMPTSEFVRLWPTEKGQAKRRARDRRLPGGDSKKQVQATPVKKHKAADLLDSPESPAKHSPVPAEAASNETKDAAKARSAIKGSRRAAEEEASGADSESKLRGKPATSATKIPKKRKADPDSTKKSGKREVKHKTEAQPPRAKMKSSQGASPKAGLSAGRGGDGDGGDDGGGSGSSSSYASSSSKGSSGRSNSRSSSSTSDTSSGSSGGSRGSSSSSSSSSSKPNNRRQQQHQRPTGRGPRKEDSGVERHMCRSFASGNCSWGSDCRYLHGTVGPNGISFG